MEIEDLSPMEIANIGFSPDQRTPKFEFKSVLDLAAGACIVLEEPFGTKYAYSFQLDFDSTNNKAEYEALIIGLEMALELGVKHLEVFGDSQLVIKQLTNEYKCRYPNMAARNLGSVFRTISVKYKCRYK
ncbi:unnamed protein product [Prunus brigantina]